MGIFALAVQAQQAVSNYWYGDTKPTSTLPTINNHGMHEVRDGVLTSFPKPDPAYADIIEAVHRERQETRAKRQASTTLQIGTETYQQKRGCYNFTGDDLVIVHGRLIPDNYQPGDPIEDGYFAHNLTVTNPSKDAVLRKSVKDVESAGYLLDVPGQAIQPSRLRDLYNGVAKYCGYPKYVLKGELGCGTAERLTSEDPTGKEESESVRTNSSTPHFYRLALSDAKSRRTWLNYDEKGLSGTDQDREFGVKQNNRTLKIISQFAPITDPVNKKDLTGFYTPYEGGNLYPAVARDAAENFAISKWNIANISVERLTSVFINQTNQLASFKAKEVLDYCLEAVKDRTPTMTPSTEGVAETPGPYIDADGDEFYDAPDNAGSIAGGVLGGAMGVGALGLAAAALCKLKKDKDRMNAQEETPATAAEPQTTVIEMTAPAVPEDWVDVRPPTAPTESAPAILPVEQLPDWEVV